jgi:hypothetical protein
VVVGLDRPLVVDQVDGLGAEQPEVPPDFGEELALAEIVERSLEQLEAQQLVAPKLEEGLGSDIHIANPTLCRDGEDGMG